MLSRVPELLCCTWVLGECLQHQTCQLLSLCCAEERGQARGLSLAKGEAGELHTCHPCPRFSWELTEQLFVSADGKIMR